MLDWWLVVVGLLALLVSAVARRLDQWAVSVPMIALLVGVALGPHGVRLLDAPVQGDPAILETAARLLLAVALMAIALRYPIDEVQRSLVPVVWLLVVLLPGMALLGGLAASVTLGIAFPVALTLGAALAPTDPVLASAVVGGEEARRTLPDHLRQWLSLESGANDGLALALVLVAASLVTADRSFAGTLLEALWELLGALVIGVALGWVAGKALRRAETRRDVDESGRLTFTLVLSFTALGLGTLAGTDGLLAVFVTGLAFNATASGRERETEYTIDEALNRFLVLPFFVLFGVSLPLAAWRDLGPGAVAFIVLLLVVRRLPLALLLRPVLPATTAGVAWLGWFGPMGTAAVYYLAHLQNLGVLDPRVWHAGSLAVAASTVVHGVTASLTLPLYKRASVTASR